MSITCPKCNHIRTATDTAPDYSCPNCGIVYAKYDAQADLARRIDRAAKTGNWSGVPPEQIPQQVQTRLQAREAALPQKASEQQRRQAEAKAIAAEAATKAQKTASRAEAAPAPMSSASPEKATNAPTTIKTVPGLILIVVVSSVLIWSKSGETTSDNTQNRHQSSDTSAFVQCKNFVQERLRAPATADFPFLERTSWDMGNNTWVVKSHVDSQNGFGAMIRSKWYCKVQYVGGNTSDPRSWHLLAIELQ